MEDSYHKNQADAALRIAHKLLRKAKELQKDDQNNDAERLFRQSLAKIREATLWEPEKSAHYKYLHEVGQFVHDTFECRLEFKYGSYWVSCPVLLSHNRLGFSVGGSSKVICSICGDELLFCPHVKGELYDQVIARHHKELCNICGKNRCKHKEGHSYNRVRAFGIITDLEVDHIALVYNPANPLAVILKRSVSESELLNMLPKDERDHFVYGETDVYCHHCVVCDGTQSD